MRGSATLRRVLRGANVALLAVCLAGCVSGPSFVKPTSGLREALLTPREEHGAAETVSEAKVPDDWWTLFKDPALTELQEQASAGNLDLKLAAERIDESRAQLGIASSQSLPDLAVGGAYSRERLSEHGKFAALGAPVGPSDFWQVAFDASWEIDLWGRARRARESAHATLEASFYEREAMRVGLSAEVARNYLRLRGTQAQLDIARQNLAIAERALALAESRERNGIASRFESTSARAQVATISAMVPELEQARNVFVNALALLLGERPRALEDRLRKQVPLPVLPEHVPVGVPSELAQRRPDVRRAEAQLHAATAAIGIAEADFYPRIALRGRAGLEAFDSGDLDSWGSRFFVVGPTVYLPLFQGGRLKERLALTEARQRGAALAYRQTVLRAWHEVDDALDAWATQRRRHAELQVSYDQNRQSLQAAERAYQEGASDYLSVLTAQQNLLASQTRLNESATNATLTVVNLYKSLGGGWRPGQYEAVPR